MSGDFTRKTFDKKKHYSAVHLQQGRVLLDADWNEHSDIIQHRKHTETKDVIGQCGVPKSENGFQVSIYSGEDDLIILPGKIYVGGLLCELESTDAPVTYFHQPHYPNPDAACFLTSPPSSPPSSPPESPPLSPPAPASAIGMKDGTYVVYLDAWQREVNYLEDPLIKESALGEADTTTRLKTVWQVKLLEVTPDPGPEISCPDSFPEWIEKTTPSTAKLNARTNQNQNPAEVCEPPPGTGYQRIENQLYRIEIHKGGTRDQATFKWSRDNASVQTKITNIDGTIITVNDLGKDEVLGFKPDDWVEIIDQEVALNCTEQPLFQIETIKPETKEIQLRNSADSFKGKTNLRLCRWDQSGSTAQSDGIALSAEWLSVEGGIEIQFSEGNYHNGDYWLIPARTATGEIEWPPFQIPNKNPEEQLPVGIKHHYCKLALLKVNSGQGGLEDCRQLFPPLTDLFAEDIKYDNSYCKNNNANNVQQVIDMLCALNDVRDHNKFLHGYGVVCGLKVICGGERTDVIVEKGYALDCDGNVIQVKEINELPYDVVTEAATSNLLDTKGDGEIGLYITGCSTQGPELSIEKYIEKDFWDRVLEGTLLKDFYDGCIQNLFDFLKKNFTIDFSDTVPLPSSQKRVTALINLFTQLLNSSSGPYAFISGNNAILREDIDCLDEEAIGAYEDHILWCLYKELRELLESQTYCAMFDGDRLFPVYEIDPGLETIFGPVLRLHYKLTLYPTGEYAYTCGLDNKIYVYDLIKKELKQALLFPASKNILVQDLLINSSGTELFALGLLEDKDSVFAKAKIDSDGNITWGKTSVLCGTKYKSLAINQSDIIYAIQVAVGIFEVKNIGLASFSSTLIKSFNATGMLILSEDDKYAYAAQYQTNTNESLLFTHIAKIDLINSASALVAFPFEGNDFGDDMAVVDKVLYLSGESKINPGQRVLHKFSEAASPPSLEEVNLDDSWMIKMAGYTKDDGEKCLLITLADKFKVVRVDLKNFAIDQLFRIPVQSFPMGITVYQEKKKAYVLNLIVNTLTDIDLVVALNTVNPPNFVEEPPHLIADYRDGVIDAFADLLSHFLQYLKDCFCDKFLVDCPQCSKDDKVYLATVQIKSRKVYHINNFSKRKYVKSPELKEYWLSALPVMPVFKEAFKEFCGSILNP